MNDLVSELVTMKVLRKPKDEGVHPNMSAVNVIRGRFACPCLYARSKVAGVQLFVTHGSTW